MAKLHGGAFANMVSTSEASEAQQQEAAANITPCVILKNMFNPAQETDPDFDLDIREDVMDEVQKYGTLRHIYVDKTSPMGLVYLKFQGHEGAKKTFDALNGRWFAQNQIKAQYMPEH